jgi:tol-pal system protein YbgF
MRKIGEFISVPGNRMVKRVLVYGFWAFLSAGCALQSSVVDLEQEVDKMKKVQAEILHIRASLDKMAAKSRPTSPDLPKGGAVLLAEINRLKEQVRHLEGRIEEGERKGAQFGQGSEDQAHQVNLLGKRVELLEQRVSATKENAGKEKTEEKADMVSPKGENGTQTPTLSPTEAYHLAYNDYLKGNYDLAIISFQNYIEQYPKSSAVPEAIYWIGQSHYNQEAYPEAISFFERIESNYPAHDKVPNALLKGAFSYIELSQPDRAKELLSRLIERFPQSNEAYRARDTLSTLSQ